MDHLLLKILLVVAICTIQGAQSKQSWYKAMGWCSNGAQLFTGDFNGDGRADMLCHRPKDGYKWIALANSAGEFTGTSWGADLKWCYHEGSRLHLGDFNGDGRTDISCHDEEGYHWVALANSAGQFTENSWVKHMKWCYHEGSKVEIGDFNGDGRDDMLCDAGGHMWIALANQDGSFTANTWDKAILWCAQENGAKTYIGDFNNDHRDDLLCHDDTGKNTVMLAQSGGSFTGNIDWSSKSPFCAGEDFHVGDMNGDNRADMVCNVRASGKTSISFANDNVQNLFTGTPTNGRTRQCSGNKVLYLADFDGNNEDDMLCHDTVTGEKWIDYSSYGAVATQPPASYVAVGCFKDSKKSRALKEKIANFIPTYDADRPRETAIEPCAEEAKKRGYHYFGVQYSGECWSAPDSEASVRYNKYGSANGCANNVGGYLQNMVFKFTSFG